MIGYVITALIAIVVTAAITYVATTVYQKKM